MRIKYRMKNSERILLQFKDDERKGFRLLYDSFYDSLVLFATQFIGEAEEGCRYCSRVFCRFLGESSFFFVTGKFGTLSFLGSKTWMFELFAKYPSAGG